MPKIPTKRKKHAQDSYKKHAQDSYEETPLERALEKVSMGPYASVSEAVGVTVTLSNAVKETVEKCCQKDIERSVKKLLAKDLGVFVVGDTEFEDQVNDSIPDDWAEAGGFFSVDRFNFIINLADFCDLPGVEIWTDESDMDLDSVEGKAALKAAGIRYGDGEEFTCMEDLCDEYHLLQISVVAASP